MDRLQTGNWWKKLTASSGAWATRYRACLAVEALEKSHRGADGSSAARARRQNRIAEGDTLAL